MGTNVRIEMNSAGVQELLKSAEMQAEVKRHATLIAEHAGPGMVVKDDVGKTRARAIVITDTEEAIIAEATNRTLTRAIPAGRTS